MERCKLLTSPDSFSKEVALFPRGGQKTTHNVRYFASLFGDSELHSYFCRRNCDVIANILSQNVQMRYVYTRKRQLDKLPLGHI